MKDNTTQDQTEKDKLKRLDKLAWLLDSSIRIPGTSRTIGLDGLIGLIPGVGDLVTGIISGYIVLESLRSGVSWWVVGRMLLNVLLESVVGAVPILGDIFDFIFKANERNVNLVREYSQNTTATKRRSGAQLAFAIAALVFIVIAIIYLVVSILSALFSMVG